MKEEFICDNCKGTFIKAWSEEEALKEAKENGFDANTCVMVCDDCYKKIMELNNPTE